MSVQFCKDNSNPHKTGHTKIEQQKNICSIADSVGTQIGGAL